MTNPFQPHTKPDAKPGRVRVRFAPSPTGFLHIGGLRTALYNELLARRHGGDFILRIEDTDQSRAVAGGIENICRSLAATGVIPNEGVWLDADDRIIQRGGVGPYIQSERRARYHAAAASLIEGGHAYECFCAPERLDALREKQHAARKPTMYDGHCREHDRHEARRRVEKGEKHVVRLKLPKAGSVTVWDAVRDDVTFDWAGIDDQIIMKSDGFPTYHLAATVDDHDMGITHVIRGEEWLPSSPKHLFIYKAFGWTPPVFAHLPLLLNPDHSKLSKRQGDVAVEDYLAKGYLPEALVNFVALLGWNPSADRDVYSHDELAAAFDLAKVNKAGAVFNIEKLDWLNAQHLRTMPEERYLELVRPFLPKTTRDEDFVRRCLLLVRDRVIRTSDVRLCTAYLFEKTLTYDDVSLTWKTQEPIQAVERLKAVDELLHGLDEEAVLDAHAVERAVKQLIAERGWGNGDTLWPLRVALSGQEKSPGPFELIACYGTIRARQRIRDAVKRLKA
ncbi:glutamate--tRNA ligase [Candidatus Uhrbacteria bacterium]|nr:glutamate--tRNA ligase [Candidatus Uhrbacteria bacterium]